VLRRKKAKAISVLAVGKKRLLLRCKVGMVSICGGPGGGKLDHRYEAKHEE